MRPQTIFLALTLAGCGAAPCSVAPSAPVASQTERAPTKSAAQTLEPAPCITPPQPVRGEARVDPEWPYPSTSVLDDMPPSHRPRPREIPCLRSASLRRLAALTEAPLEQLAFVLGEPSEQTPLERALRGCAELHLQPAPLDFVYSSEAEPTSGPLSVASFDVGDSRPAAEVTRIERWLRAATWSAPGLSAHALGARWSDVNGAAYQGVAFVDRGTREVLWVHAWTSWTM